MEVDNIRVSTHGSLILQFVPLGKISKDSGNHTLPLWVLLLFLHALLEGLSHT